MRIQRRATFSLDLAELIVNSPAKLRTAQLDDADRLHQLHTSSVRALCTSHYASEVIEGWLHDRTPKGYLEPISRGAIFVAESGRDVVGFGEAAEGVVIAVYVEPSMAGRGIGRLILEHALSIARSGEAGPVMVEATLNACEFYRHHGFAEVRRATVRRNNVEVPIVVMRLLSVGAA
jgi:GNAT superfamily N-acetyltransferase